jgi:hypothetical protein
MLRCWTSQGEVLDEVEEQELTHRYSEFRDCYFRTPLYTHPDYPSRGYVELCRLAARTGNLQVKEDEVFKLRTPFGNSGLLGRNVEVEISRAMGMCTIVDWTDSSGETCSVTHIPLTWANDALVGRCLAVLVQEDNFAELESCLPDDRLKRLANGLRNAHVKTEKTQPTPDSQ